MKTLITILFILLPIMAAKAQFDGRIIRVGIDSDVKTISHALETAEDGDRIIISAGRYAEHSLIVNSRVHISADGEVLIDGERNGFLLRIIRDSVVVDGLSFTGTGISFTRDHGAIEIEKAHYVTIRNTTIIDSFFGIYLAGTTGSIVENNQLSASGIREANTGNGIHLWDCRDITVHNNIIEGHRDGIYLEFVKRAVITGNISRNNIRYGLHFMFSDDSEYLNNEFRNNGAGVAVMYSKNVHMLNNKFTDNWGPAAYGLLLKDISDSRIIGNTFQQNTVAIHSEGSSRILLEGNIIERNGWAIKIMANSQENIITGNNFIENTFDVSTNSRRNFNTFEGNYWSGYNGYDLSGSGTGDVAYRPVRLYALIVERNPAALILIRGFFIDLLDLAERIIPVLTPETLVDAHPKMKAFDL